MNSLSSKQKFIDYYLAALLKKLRRTPSLKALLSPLKKSARNLKKELPVSKMFTLYHL
jgi:hypothetical protein